MNQHVQEWNNVAADPYDNYSDVRQDMQARNARRGQANPAAQQYQQPQYQQPQYQQQPPTPQYQPHQPYYPQYEEVYAGQPQYDEDVINDIFYEEAIIAEETAVEHEALLRIEQANLYQILLNHELISPGSARPEIQEKVQKELKAFVLSQLESLLGMSSGGQYANLRQPVAQPQFTDEEKEALKALAARMLVKKPEVAPAQAQQSAPSITPLQTTPVKPKVAPTVAPVATKPVVAPKAPTATKAKTPVTVRQPQKTAPKKAPAPKAPIDPNNLTPEQAAEIAKSRPRKGAASNISRPLPMPTQDMMNQHTEIQTARSSSAGGADIISKAISQSLKTP